MPMGVTYIMWKFASVSFIRFTSHCFAFLTLSGKPANSVSFKMRGHELSLPDATFVAESCKRYCSGYSRGDIRAHALLQYIDALVSY